MELADILSEGSVLACDKVKDKADLLGILAEHAAKVTGQDAGAIFEALSGREALGSTGLGNGIAIPHGKLAGLKGVVAVFARLAQPVEFDAVDDQPVDLIVMLLAPTGAGADHLKALARVSRLLRNQQTVEKLRAATKPEALYAILTEPTTSTNSRAA